MAHSNVLWTRNRNQDEEIWDDSEVIAAYDRAMAKIKNEISRRNKLSPEGSDEKEQEVTEWKQGDYCTCVYSGDNKVYEAKIKYIKGKYCTVHFIGYGNEERVLLSDISPSEGKKARQMQQAKARSAVHTSSPTTGSGNPSKQSRPRKFQTSSLPNRSQQWRSWNQPPPSFPDPMRLPSIPPPPPPALDGDIKNDEALASMLMSWYMSGYHTGYYQAVRQTKDGCCCQGHRCS